MKNEGRFAGENTIRFWLTILIAIWLSACTGPAVDSVDSPPIIPPVVVTNMQLSPTPTLELDACLEGEWEVVDESLAAFLTGAIMGKREADFELLDSRGSLSLHFSPDGELRMHSNDYQMTLEVRPQDTAIQRTVLRILISANGAASYMVSGEALISYQANYDAIIPDPFPIQIRETGISAAPLQIDPGWFVSQVLEAGELEGQIPLDTPAHFTAYICTADLLTLESPPFGPMEFTRQDPGAEQQ